MELILTEEKAGVLQDLVKKGKTDLAFMYQTDPELECHMIAENLVYIQVPPAFTEGKTGWKPGAEPRLYVHSGHCGVAADAGWAERLLLPGEGLSHEAEPVLLLPGAELSDRGGAVSDQSDSEDGAVVGIGASALSGRSAA